MSTTTTTTVGGGGGGKVWWVLNYRDDNSIIVSPICQTKNSLTWYNAQISLHALRRETRTLSHNWPLISGQFATHSHHKV